VFGSPLWDGVGLVAPDYADVRRASNGGHKEGVGEADRRRKAVVDIASTGPASGDAKKAAHSEPAGR
jgi:hypothetical protein